MAVGDRAQRLHAAGGDDHPHGHEGPAGDGRALVALRVRAGGQAPHLLDGERRLVDQRARAPLRDDEVGLHARALQHLEERGSPKMLPVAPVMATTRRRGGAATFVT